MKKILLATALIMMIGLFANAQGRDGFFSSWDNDNYENRATDPSFSLNFPNHFDSDDNGAPLGSGLIILSALGAGYAVARKRKK